MLQHSREGSGEHRVIDINALVEESLNLAWHGARAETQGFEIKLKQFFDPSAGGVDVFPQDIRRALLNLIANGFYAATRRRAETNGGDYEPTLTAWTKNLGDRVEIRIRDNGTGMTPEVKEKMFEPFFSTKPTGEGTGLGLSISHDIIVKQHAGAIEVDTQPGAGLFCRAPLCSSDLGEGSLQAFSKCISSIGVLCYQSLAKMRAQTRPRGRGDRDFKDGPTCIGESSDISVAPHLRSGAVKGRNVSNRSWAGSCAAAPD
jgi:Histidine kinase-, DNA gyrase B-, and HSP90-like ATPase